MNMSNKRSKPARVMRRATSMFSSVAVQQRSPSGPPAAAELIARAKYIDGKWQRVALDGAVLH
jgi:hypothetical protein